MGSTDSAPSSPCPSPWLLRGIRRWFPRRRQSPRRKRARLASTGRLLPWSTLRATRVGDGLGRAAGGSDRDPPMVSAAQAIAAKEASSVGINWTFAPMVDIARDPRWGRIVEGAGEDPWLGSAMAAARSEEHTSET